MIDVTQISSSLELLKSAQQDLVRLREQFAGRPDLLKFYETSARHLVAMIQSSIREALGDPGVQDSVDMWIHLGGEVFSEGRAPAGLLARFLNRLTIANQHAISVLDTQAGVGSGARPPRRVEALAEFDVVAIRSGSLRLGISRPDPRRFIRETFDQPQLPLFDAIEKQYAQALRDAEYSIEGLRLLARALVASTSDDELNALAGDLGDAHKLLELLQSVEPIIPSNRSLIESISFYGWKRDRPAECLKVTPDTRKHLRKRVASLFPQIREVEVEGIIRAVDLDKKTFVLRHFSLEEETVEEISSRFPPETTEEDIERVLNRRVAVSGLLTRSRTGGSRLLETESVAFATDAT